MKKTVKYLAAAFLAGAVMLSGCSKPERTWMFIGQDSFWKADRMNAVRCVYQCWIRMRAESNRALTAGCWGKTLMGSSSSASLKRLTWI